MITINKKLSAKLSLSVLGLVSLLFVFTIGLLFLQSRYVFRQMAAKRADNALNTVMQQVRNYMTTIETATNSNAWLVEENFEPEALLDISRRVVQLNHHINGCSVTAEPYMFPECGRYFSAYTIHEKRQTLTGMLDTIVTVREAGYDYYDKVWYKTPRQLGKGCWVGPYDDYNEGTLYTTELIASYCKPLYLKDGSIAGVMATDISFRNLSEALNEAEHPYPHAYYALIDADGRYLIHPDTAVVFRKTVFTDYKPDEHPDLVALGHEMVAGNHGQMHIYVYDERFHVSYRQVPGTNWSLALICPDSEILKGYYQLVYMVIIVIVIGLLLILWLCRRAVNIAIKPITNLSIRAQRISKGHYNETIPRTNRQDAIGRLQNSFATMQRSLDERVNSIQKATEESEKRNEELVIAKQKAEEAARHKDLFIQNVSHQVRTPLNIILGFVDILKSHMLVSEDKNEIVKMMKHNSMHLNRMVQMLYDSSETGLANESQLPKNDVVCCNDVGRDSIEYLKERYPQVTLRFEPTLSDDVTIKTNRKCLLLTVRELVYNAAKYSDGQHVSITITETPNAIRFIVEDVGPGLSESVQKGLFKPFTKVDDMSEGLGLGLPLCKRHMLSLGGDLIYDADYHDGCRFIAVLPKA